MYYGKPEYGGQGNFMGGAGGEWKNGKMDGKKTKKLEEREKD